MLSSDASSLPVALLCGAILIAGTLLYVGPLVRSSDPVSLRLLGPVLIGVHFVVGLILLAFIGIGTTDAQQYHDSAVQQVMHWHGELADPPHLVDGKSGWVLLLGLLYAAGGASPVLGVAVNSVLLALIPIISFRTMRLFGIEEAASVKVAMLLAIVPAYWTWGSLPLREASVNLLLALALYYLLSAIIRARMSDWILLLFSLGGLLVFRGSLAMIVLVGVVVTLFIAALTGRGSRRLWLVLLPGLAGGLLLIQFAFSVAGSDVSLDRISAVRSSQSSTATTGFDNGGSVATTGQAVGSAVRVFPRILVGPFPWEINGSLVLLVPDILMWWAFLFLSWQAYRKRKCIHAPCWIAAVPLLGLLIALAVYSGNYGTMIRLRSMGVVLLAPLVAAYFATRERDAIAAHGPSSRVRIHKRVR